MQTLHSRLCVFTPLRPVSLSLSVPSICSLYTVNYKKIHGVYPLDDIGFCEPTIDLSDAIIYFSGNDLVNAL